MQAKRLQRARIMLTDAELVAMLAELPKIGRQIELASKILLASCTSIGELIRAGWKRGNFEHKEWTAPPEHSKNKKQFVIPHTEQVAGWFMELPGLAFAGRAGGRL